jgi:hypothetical protein
MAGKKDLRTGIKKQRNKYLASDEKLIALTSEGN